MAKLGTTTPRTPAPKSGKGYVLNARITGETRQALEAEAARTGRSISQVAEIWIEQGRGLNRLGPAGFGVGEALTTMLSFAVAVGAEIGDPYNSFAARDALKLGWAELAARSMPFAIDKSAAGEDARSTRRSLRQATDVAREGMIAADLQMRDDGLFLALKALGDGTLAAPGSDEWSAASRELQSVEAESDQLAAILGPVIAAMPPCERAALAFMKQRNAAKRAALELLERFLPDTEMSDLSDPGA